MSMHLQASGWRWVIVPALIACRAVAADNDSYALPVVLGHLTTADGLPQGTVYSTLQDSQGFVWLGTEDGLVRYDGHELVRYGYSRTARSGLPGNFIQGIVEDAHHDLWIAVVDSGLARWNRHTNTFTVYRHDPARTDSLASDAVRTILVDGRDRIWVGTRDSGVDVLDPASGRIEHRRHDPLRADSLADDRVKVLGRDRSGGLWVGTEGGLDRLLPDGESFTHYRHVAGDSGSLSSDIISQVVEDAAGVVWVGTFDGGLNRMDGNGRVTATYRHDPHVASSLIHDDVRAILEDQAGHLWIGTADGLDLFERSTGRFTHYRHDQRDAGSLRDSFVMSLYEDSSGLVWIGTRAGGVSRWNPRSWDLGGRRPPWLEGKLVTAFADAPEHQVWLASLGGGLVRFDPATGEQVNIDSLVHRRNAIGDQRVMSLEVDRHGTLWIGTYTNGLSKLSREGHLETIPVELGGARSLSSPGVMAIYESRDGRIWIGTHGGGANVLDPATGLIQQLSHDPAVPGAISGANVTSFAEDRAGNLWMGTDGGGLNLARPDGTVIKVFRHDPEDIASLSANTVYAIAVDGEGRVWIATDGGGLELVKGSSAAPEAVTFENLSRADGLTSDTIYGLLVDSGGRLWMSGDAGLMRYEAQTRKLKTFHVEQGLQGEEFNLGAYRRLRDGRFCFGGPGGFNIFDPSALVEQAKAPRIALMHADVLGIPLQSATPYWLLKEIDLNYQAAIVSLDFGALDFTSPQRNRMSYRMPGLTDHWIDLGTQHHVTLTNLDAGDHVLEVRAASADSVWSDAPFVLKLHRSPAPWKSIWALAGYAGVALWLLAFGLQRQRRKIWDAIKAKELLEAEVESRTQQLIASNRLLEEAAQAKSAFLARMTHELRTPMNGVVGTTELLERTALSSVQARLTKTIRSSADVLLQIVNHLLDLSKAQAGKIELEIIPIDLALILEECTASFAGAAAAKGIELTFCPPHSTERALLGDPLRTRQIFLNLIGNAVKFTDRGHIDIEANLGSEAEGRTIAEVIIRDTGIGMTPLSISKIFEPFTQADESTTRRFGGTGLGLAICRELSHLMGGTISVESCLGVGSIFRVSLPLRIAEHPPRAMPQPPLRGTLSVMTRQPALAEAITRHARAFGLTVSDGAGSAAATLVDTSDVIVVDAATDLDYLRSRLATSDPHRNSFVVLATSAELEALSLMPLISPEAFVLKPVQRADLYRAISAVLGTMPAVPDQAGQFGKPLGSHVLIVDDEPVNAAVAQGYLGAIGCTSIWVQDGAAALARCAGEKFDLVLMDLSMPGMDGFTTAGALRERPGANQLTPIVALTAHDADTYRERCLQAGMNDLLEKPYTLDQCATMLRRWRSQDLDQTPAGASASRIVPSSRIDHGVVAGLRKMTARGQHDLYSRLVELFEAASSTDFDSLRAALDSRDLASAATICHKLRSSAGNVGAVDFAAGLRTLERLLSVGDDSGSQRQFKVLIGAYPSLIEDLRMLKVSAGA